MKNLIPLLVLSTALVACNESGRKGSVSNDNNTNLVATASMTEVALERVKKISAGGLDFFFDPETLYFETTDGNILRDRASGERVAEITLVEGSAIKGVTIDTSGTNPKLNISNGERSLIVEILSLKDVERILPYNIYDRKGGNKKNILIDTITVSKEDRAQYQNYAQDVSEAPIQNLTANILNIGPKKMGTYEFWFNHELKMVRENERTTLRERSFEIIESIDMTSADEDNFKVEASYKELDSQYNIFEFVIRNVDDNGAFVTSNPISALGYKCNGFRYSTSITSKRVEDGIKYTLPVNKNMVQNCLKSGQLSGKIYVFDSLLNFKAINF